MTDLHETFATWLLHGGRDELPRDVALHASTCPGCLGGAAAVDALGTVDPGAAEPPPLRVVGHYRRRRGLAPAVTGALAVLLVVVAGAAVSGNLFDPPRSAGVAATTPTPAEAVLGDQGGPSVTATPTASPTPSESATPSPTAEPTATSAPSAQPAEPNPTMGGGPPPPPPPSVGPAATPTPRPTPTSAPTPAPTPTPTVPPTPTPSPALDDCEDGIDNDGDLLIDALDPGCALTGDEAGDAVP
jgi:hypothetical protein